MKRIKDILLFALLAIVWSAYGQKTDLENDLLVGKVKNCERFNYEFDISDSINHDDFMNRFYQCGFGVDEMLRFADSLNVKYSRKKYRYYYEYDTMGYHTRIGDNDSFCYWREYNPQGRILKVYREENHISMEIASNKYDDNGRLLEEKWLNHTTQYVYNSDGKLLERKRFEEDSLVAHWKIRYDKNGTLRKAKGFGTFMGRWESGLMSFDSRGNETFHRTEIKDGYIEKTRTRYKYDMNDSIVKIIRNDTRWIPYTMDESEYWEEIDSTGNVTNNANYKVSHRKSKEKYKSEKRTIRNEQGCPVRVERMSDNVSGKYITNSEYDSIGQLIKCEELAVTKNDTITESVVEYKYDELGRVVETISKDFIHPYYSKTIWKYHKDTEFYSYIGRYRYNGENSDLVQESQFFFDEKDNCIAHVQWMPKSTNSEYYFRVYKIEYYD